MGDSNLRTILYEGNSLQVDHCNILYPNNIAPVVLKKSQKKKYIFHKTITQKGKRMLTIITDELALDLDDIHSISQNQDPKRSYDSWLIIFKSRPEVIVINKQSLAALMALLK